MVPSDKTFSAALRLDFELQAPEMLWGAVITSPPQNLLRFPINSFFTPFLDGMCGLDLCLPSFEIDQYPPGECLTWAEIFLDLGKYGRHVFQIKRNNHKDLKKSESI